MLGCWGVAKKGCVCEANSGTSEGLTKGPVVQQLGAAAACVVRSSMRVYVPRRGAPLSHSTPQTRRIGHIPEAFVYCANRTLQKESPFFHVLFPLPLSLKGRTRARGQCSTSAHYQQTPGGTRRCWLPRYNRPAHTTVAQSQILSDPVSDSPKWRSMTYLIGLSLQVNS